VNCAPGLKGLMQLQLLNVIQTNPDPTPLALSCSAADFGIPIFLNTSNLRTIARRTQDYRNIKLFALILGLAGDRNRYNCGANHSANHYDFFGIPRLHLKYIFHCINCLMNFFLGCRRRWQWFHWSGTLPTTHEKRISGMKDKIFLLIFAFLPSLEKP
jgi:hypothetical protein